MRVLITGICGFVGSILARCLTEEGGSAGRIEVFGLDNFSRPGSELNRDALRRRGIRVHHGDLRCRDDLENLPNADWVIDAAAQPSVLGGVNGQSSTRQVLDHNLASTINLLEYCRARQAGFILLSTSRVYGIQPLAALPVRVRDGAFVPDLNGSVERGLSDQGVSEEFPVAPPISIYGVSKLASEVIALEYGEDFGFPVWLNRCGVLAGAGQFGQAEQGIYSFWINSFCRKRPLKYIGFEGSGHQVRDCLHPRDLVPLIRRQLTFSGAPRTRIFNLGGGPSRAMSLRQLSEWCEARFGRHEVSSEPQGRRFDIPWLVMDSRLAREFWGWEPETSLEEILSEIADHAAANERWLEQSSSS